MTLGNSSWTVNGPWNLGALSRTYWDYPISYRTKMRPRRLCRARGPSRLLCLNQRHINQVLTQKPHLKFISAQYLADNEIVCTIIPNGGCATRQLADFANDDLVRIE